MIASLLLWLLPVLAAGLLLWRWHGRRVACPPSCRRCGYDVSARPAGSDRCSECGADLAGRRSVVTARRVRGQATTGVLAALLVASAVWFVHLAWPFEWERWYWANAPDGWVAAHAEGRSGPFADRALTVWLGRYAGGRLDAAGESRLHDHLLARQADPAHGDLLHAALEAKKLSPAQAERFVRGTFPGITFAARPAVRAGDPVAFGFSAAGFRGGGRRSAWSAALGATASFAGPPKVPADNTWGWGWGGWDGSLWTQVAFPKEAGTPGLAPGVRRLDLVVAVALTAGRSSDERLTPAVEYRGAVDVEVLPAGAAVGTPVFDAAAGDAVARATRVGVFHWDDGRIFARVALEPAPVDRAFEIFVRGDPLAGSVGQQKYWSGTIKFPDLPLRPREQAYGGGPDPLPPYRLTAARGP